MLGKSTSIVDPVKCTPDTCENNGTCKEIVNGIECTCTKDFKGNNCEFSLNDLKGISNSAVNTLATLGDTIDDNSNEAVDNLNTSISLDNSLVTKELNDFVINYSSKVNDIVVKGKISDIDPIMNIYNLGMGTSL